MIGTGGGTSGPPAARRSAGRSSEREAWIALSTRPGIGPAAFARLVLEQGSALDAWRAWRPPASPQGGLPADARAIARRLSEATAAAGGRIVTVLDDDYPPALLALDPRPPTLFIAGPAEVFRRRAVAIVGTRRASSYGLASATEIAHDLAASGVAVVSGLALGVDGAAHRATVAAGGVGIAVLPSPLDRVYPPRHRPLARDLVRRGGALVSEIAAGIPIGKPDFARRNRIIAGLAEAVVVVEAPDRSGALLTAAAATAIGGRELYAVPGPIDAMASRGCNRLIADHQALLVTSSAWLLHQIGVSAGRRPPSVGSLSEVEGLVLRVLLERPGSIEELVDRARQPAASVASALTMLESRGLVDAYAGATFHATIAAKRLADVV